jgi:hypothetical protein
MTGIAAGSVLWEFDFCMIFLAESRLVFVPRIKQAEFLGAVNRLA